MRTNKSEPSETHSDAKLNGEKTWKTIYCIGCAEPIDHNVSWRDMEENESLGYTALMCLSCVDELRELVKPRPVVDRQVQLGI